MEQTQTEQQLKGQLEQEKKVLGQRLDQEPAKREEPMGQKEGQLLEQQHGQLKQPVCVPAPNQVQETHPGLPLKGKALPSEEAGGVVPSKHK